MGREGCWWKGAACGLHVGCVSPGAGAGVQPCGYLQSSPSACSLLSLIHIRYDARLTPLQSLSTMQDGQSSGSEVKPQLYRLLSSTTTEGARVGSVARLVERWCGVHQALGLSSAECVARLSSQHQKVKEAGRSDCLGHSRPS